jgi:hypothetical protein
LHERVVFKRDARQKGGKEGGIDGGIERERARKREGGRGREGRRESQWFPQVKRNRTPW